jgi:hypothetical protein
MCGGILAQRSTLVRRARPPTPACSGNQHTRAVAGPGNGVFTLELGRAVQQIHSSSTTVLTERGGQLLFHLHSPASSSSSSSARTKKTVPRWTLAAGTTNTTDNILMLRMEIIAIDNVHTHTHTHCGGGGSTGNNNKHQQQGVVSLSIVSRSVSSSSTHTHTHTHTRARAHNGTTDNHHDDVTRTHAPFGAKCGPWW